MFALLPTIIQNWLTFIQLKVNQLIVLQRASKHLHAGNEIIKSRINFTFSKYQYETNRAKLLKVLIQNFWGKIVLDSSVFVFYCANTFTPHIALPYIIHKIQ